MPAITALDTIKDAFQILNVTVAGETPSANDASFALGRLNGLVSSWRQRSLLVNAISRERFSLVSGQGGIGNPYTIGPGGDFDTDRPPNQNSVVGAHLIYTTSSPESRVPLTLFTDSQWASLATPGLEGTQPSGVYYDPTYADGWGSIYLWPIPNTAINALELFIAHVLSRFTDLSTVYQVPDGYDTALTYNLAKRLAGPYGRQMAQEDSDFARESLGVIKRSNSKPVYQANDYGRGARYDINSGVTFYR